jgi:hypothetical protein
MLEVSDIEPFLERWNRWRGVHYKANYPNSVCEPLTASPCGKSLQLFRVVAGHSVYAFIDRENGDILFPGSWAQPSRAKSRVRGNALRIIRGEDLLESAVGVFGVRHARG